MALRFGAPHVLNQMVNASRVRDRIVRARGRRQHYWDPIPAWLDRYARGRSFLDIGTMWGEQWGAFEAADHGATSIATLDVTPPTEACRAEQDRRGHPVRHVTGDLHDPTTLHEVGVYDVVLCSGILYHTPSPCLTLERLRSVTGEHLILGTNLSQEIPGVPQACIFYPGLKSQDRLALAAPIAGVADGLTTAFDPALGYSNWWWGMSPSALRAMLAATGWLVVEERYMHAPPGHHGWIVARPDPRWTPLTA